MRASAIVLALTGLLGGLVGACTTASSYACSSDAQCVSAGGQGTCEASGYCSFPDPGCPSGKRYGEYGEGGLGGSCVDGEGSSSTTSVTTTSTSTSSPTSSTGEPTTDGTSTSGPLCSELGGACGDASDCCSPCMACEGSVCVADVGAPGDCGECQACDENAACAPAAPGAACQFDCAALVYGDDVADGVYTCSAYVSTLIAGTCGGDGVCALNNQKDCTAAAGEPLVSCASACAKSGMGNCVQGDPAASVTIESVCTVNGESPACGSGCDGDSTVTRACDAVGACVVSDSVDCAPYTCNGGECLSACNNPMDCADGFSCMSKMCG
ncbi:MAG: hypothetical protein H6710_11125 [Myxococcales bacterium]|nr:hypothetical protein [Myxococcales bacterium]MCB9702442.1 hypothetical protein [Myxococcales bacterium]